MAAKDICEKDESTLNEEEIRTIKNGFSCSPCSWYRVSFSKPILDGENKSRCGPKYENASCPIDQKFWTGSENDSGPCCSLGGYCGRTVDHCENYGVDFRHVIQGLKLSIKSIREN